MSGQKTHNGLQVLRIALDEIIDALTTANQDAGTKYKFEWEWKKGDHKVINSTNNKKESFYRFELIGTYMKEVLVPKEIITGEGEHQIKRKVNVKEEEATTVALYASNYIVTAKDIGKIDLLEQKAIKEFLLQATSTLCSFSMTSYLEQEKKISKDKPKSNIIKPRKPIF